MVDSARNRPLTGLESYLSDRLRGGQKGVWADKLSFFVVALTSFHLGVLLNHGPRAQVTKLTPGEISAAEQVGFLVLKAGPDALAEALDSVRSDRKSEYLGFARDHKLFFDWLNKSNLGSDFEPIREVVRNYIFHTFPIPKGATVFGVACPRRYVHTLSTAARQHRVCKKKLADRLIEVGAGRAEAGTNKLTLPHCLEADLADAAAKDIKSMLDAKAAQRFIGATEPEFRHLRRAGIIVPDAKVGTAAKRYATAMLNQAIARLNERAVPVALVPAHCKRISRASLNAKCSMSEIFQKILNGELDFLGRLVGRHGISALVVDCREIRAFDLDGAVAGLTKDEASKALGVNYTTVTALIAGGYLHARRCRNQATRHWATLVTDSDLGAFRESYIRLADFARLVSLHPISALGILNTAGARSVVSGQGVAKVYRRADVASLIGDERSRAKTNAMPSETADHGATGD